MASGLPTSLQILARSFFLQALVTTATIALVFASSPATTADPAAVSPGPTTLASRSSIPPLSPGRVAELLLDGVWFPRLTFRLISRPDPLVLFDVRLFFV